MTQTYRIAMLLPLAVSAIAVAWTIFIHALPLSATVSFLRREKRLGRVGRGFWIDVAIVAQTITFALLAHLIEIGCWAVVSAGPGDDRPPGRNQEVHAPAIAAAGRSAMWNVVIGHHFRTGQSLTRLTARPVRLDRRSLG